MLCIPEELNSPSLSPSFLCTWQPFCWLNSTWILPLRNNGQKVRKPEGTKVTLSFFKPSFKGISQHFHHSQAKSSSALDAVQSLFLASQKPLGVAKTHLYLRESKHLWNTAWHLWHDYNTGKIVLSSKPFSSVWIIAQDKADADPL